MQQYTTRVVRVRLRGFRGKLHRIYRTTDLQATVRPLPHHQARDAQPMGERKCRDNDWLVHDSSYDPSVSYRRSTVNVRLTFNRHSQRTWC